MEHTLRTFGVGAADGLVCLARRVLPVAELVGLSAGDQGLCEVGTGLVSRSSKHKRVQRLSLAERTAHWEVWSSATVNSHRTGFVSCEGITKGNWKSVKSKNRDQIKNSDSEFLDTNMKPQFAQRLIHLMWGLFCLGTLRCFDQPKCSHMQFHASV